MRCHVVYSDRVMCGVGKGSVAEEVKCIEVKSSVPTCVVQLTAEELRVMKASAV